MTISYRQKDTNPGSRKSRDTPQWIIMITSKFASDAFNTLGARQCRRQHKVIRKATFKILNRVSVRNFSTCCQLGLGLTPSLCTYSDNLGWIRKSPEIFSLLVSLICRKDLKGQWLDICRPENVLPIQGPASASKFCSSNWVSNLKNA